jgi:hypothetical protein
VRQEVAAFGGTAPHNRYFECCRPLLPKIIMAAATSAAQRIVLTVQGAALLLRGTAQD